jgi:hypothetical protein
MNLFWIVVYCLHPNLCYVSKDAGGINPARYATAQACQAEIPDGKTDPKGQERVHHEVHLNSACHAVTAVSCSNGGSRCTFEPADLSALKALDPKAIDGPGLTQEKSR